MKGKFVPVLLLGGVSILMVVGTWWLFKSEKAPPPSDQAEEIAKELSTILDFEPEDVKKVRLIRAKDDQANQANQADQAQKFPPITLEKKGEEWVITEPFEAKADQEKVKEFIKNVAEQKADRIVDAKTAGDMATYGLTEPKHRLILSLNDGSERVLLLGKESKTYKRYAQAKGQDSLLLFSSWWAKSNIIEKKLDDFRDKTLFAFETDHVTKVTLKHGQTTLVCEKKGDQWTMLEPRKVRADKSSLETLINAIKDEKIEAFVEPEAANLAQYGLDHPQLTVTLAVAGDKTLLIGKKKDGETSSTSTSSTATGKVYAKREGDKEIFLLNASLLDKLKKEPKDLRDKTVVAVDTDRVNRVAYTIEGVTVEIAKRPLAEKPKGKEKGAEEGQEEEAWDITSPKRLKADTQKVTDLISDVKNLSARDFIDEPQDLKKYQLDPPRARVTLWEEGKPKPQVLLVGKESSKDTTSVFVKRESEPTVYTVSDWFVDKLETDLNKMRDLLVLKFDREDLQKIALKFDNKETVIQRKGESDWEVVQPEKVETETWKVTDIIGALENLRGDQFVTTKATKEKLKEYGFDKPQVQVVLTFKDKSQRTLLVGKKKDQEALVYIKMAEADPVFLETDYLATRLKKEPKDFEKTPPPEMPPGGMPPPPPE